MAHDAFFDLDQNKIFLAVHARRIIKGIGIGGIIFGVLNIGAGVAYTSENIINVFVIMLGIAMAVVGILAISKPCLKILAAETVVMGVLLAWNVLIFILNAMAGAPTGPFTLVMPAVFLFALITQYKKFRPISTMIDKMTKEQVKEAEGFCEKIMKKKDKSDPSFVSDGKVKIQLMPKDALFVSSGMSHFFLVPKQSFKAAVTKDDGKKMTIVINHPLEKLSYGLAKENAEKVRTWLAAPDAPAVNAAVGEGAQVVSSS